MQSLVEIIIGCVINILEPKWWCHRFVVSRSNRSYKTKIARWNSISLENFSSLLEGSQRTTNSRTQRPIRNCSARLFSRCHSISFIVYSHSRHELHFLSVAQWRNIRFKIRNVHCFYGDLDSDVLLVLSSSIHRHSTSWKCSSNSMGLKTYELEQSHYN